MKQPSCILCHIIQQAKYFSYDYLYAASYSGRFFKSTFYNAGCSSILQSHHIYACIVIGLLATAGLFAKDYKDKLGDAKSDTKTPVVLYGARLVQRLAFYFWLGAALIAITLSSVTIALVCVLYLYGLLLMYIHRHQGKVFRQ